MSDRSELALRDKEFLLNEIWRLRTQCGGNCRYWEGRWRDEAAQVERLRAALVEIQYCEPVKAASIANRALGADGAGKDKEG